MKSDNNLIKYFDTFNSLSRNVEGAVNSFMRNENNFNEKSHFVMFSKQIDVLCKNMQNNEECMNEKLSQYTFTL